MSSQVAVKRNLTLPIGTILLGLLLLVESFGWVGTSLNWIFPAIILVAGVIMLLKEIFGKEKNVKRYIAPVVILIVGLLLLLATLGVMVGAWILPLIVLLLGIAMLRGI
jgi:fumarate reductase subunit D